MPRDSELVKGRIYHTMISSTHVIEEEGHFMRLVTDAFVFVVTLPT